MKLLKKAIILGIGIQIGRNLTNIMFNIMDKAADAVKEKVEDMEEKKDDVPTVPMSKESKPFKGRKVMGFYNE